MDKLFANNGDPDQRPHSAVFDLGLHCFPIILLGVCRLQWVKIDFASIMKRDLLEKEIISSFSEGVC